MKNVLSRYDDDLISLGFTVTQRCNRRRGWIRGFLEIREWTLDHFRVMAHVYDDERIVFRADSNLDYLEVTNQPHWSDALRKLIERMESRANAWRTMASDLDSEAQRMTWALNRNIEFKSL